MVYVISSRVDCWTCPLHHIMLHQGLGPGTLPTELHPSPECTSNLYMINESTVSCELGSHAFYIHCIPSFERNVHIHGGPYWATPSILWHRPFTESGAHWLAELTGQHAPVLRSQLWSTRHVSYTGPLTSQQVVYPLSCLPTLPAFLDP